MSPVNAGSECRQIELEPQPAGTRETPASKQASGALHATMRPKRKPARRLWAVQAEGPDGPFTVAGQRARTLTALVHAGPAGQTPWEFPRGFRLAAYVHDLRKQQGLAIETQRVTGDDGLWRARYVLRSRVRIVEG